MFDLCDKAYVRSREGERLGGFGRDYNQGEVTKTLLEEKRRMLQRKGFFSKHCKGEGKVVVEEGEERGGKI